MRGLSGSHASRHASAWVKVYSIVPLCFAIYLLCMSCVSASPTGIMEARHGGHDDETPASSFTSTQTAASLSVSQIPAAPSSTARLSSTSLSSVAPSSSMAPVSLTTHDAEHGHSHDHGHESSGFSYDSITPEQWPAFCSVPTLADKWANADMKDCIAADQIDHPIGADVAGWGLYPSPRINHTNLHAHAHGTDPIMENLNETRLFIRKGAVPLSYVEWDFASGLGRLSELRRFVSVDAERIQAMWPNRSVIGASGGYWRTLGDIDYNVTWNALRDDIKWRTSDGVSEPARQKGLAIFSATLFIVACFILLPAVLCLQTAHSTLVPLFSLLYLAILTTSLFFGRLYFALTPELYPPSALPGLVIAYFLLSMICFGLPAAKLVLLIVPLVRGRLRSWNDLRSLMRVLTQGSSPGLYDREESFPMSMSHSAGSTDGALTDPVLSTGPGTAESSHGFGVLDQEREPGAPLLDSPVSAEEDKSIPIPMRRPYERFVHRFPRLSFTLGMIYTTVSRGLVPLAFVIVYVAIAIYTGSCRRGYKNVCLAHGIKGAIFFWYGVLTFARYLGAFGEYGWAWNKRPTPENSTHSRAAFWRRNMPSAEFVESLVIFLYGISNTWLERLGAKPGDPYTIKQIQHISIAVMFWFIGLIGMALESNKVRNILGYAVVHTHPAATPARANEDEVEAQAQPPSYVQSFNPFPSLVIGVTGVAMAAHHQDYVYEVQIHILWGEMLAAFAFFRWLTYFFMWLRPPVSTLPSRPPTEALASFALCCGGLLFMLSNEEVSFAAMRADYADVMAVLNLAISLIALVFCWSFCLMVIKAWAFKRDAQWREPVVFHAKPLDTDEPFAKEQVFAVSDDASD